MLLDNLGVTRAACAVTTWFDDARGLAVGLTLDRGGRRQSGIRTLSVEHSAIVTPIVGATQYLDRRATHGPPRLPFLGGSHPVKWLKSLILLVGAQGLEPWTR
jgi:hypothetical protein